MKNLERDFAGYGQNPPDPKWPKGARLALNFVLNYEEGGESSIQEGDAASEGFLHELVGATPELGKRNFNTESMFEYGSRAGFWRIHRLFTNMKLPLTVYAVGQALEKNPQAAKAMADAGWEVASHGYRWINYMDMPKEEEREQIKKSIHAIEITTGKRPVGWYTGRASENTRALVVEAGGFLYESDSYADDLPYWVDVNGTRHLILPYTLDANDFKFLLVNGFMTSDEFFTYLKDSFDTLYAEGEVSPKMMSVGLHARISGHPGRTAGIRRFMEYVSTFDDVWIATREEIALHWRKVHP